MAKRFAGSQINKDTFEEDSEGFEPSGGFNKASAATLSKRKIIKPKGRNFTLLASEEPKKAPMADNSGSSDDKNEKIRALNEKLLETLTNLHKPNTIADFTPALKKYIEYYEGIQNGNKTQPQSVTQPQSQPFGSQPPPSSKPQFVPPPPSSSDSESEPEKKEVKVEGPKFTLLNKPEMKNSPFTFGEKKKRPIDSDSESEVEIKGPTFQFNKEIKDSVFKFGGQSNDKPNPFSFSNNNNNNNDKSDKPAFSFGTKADDKPAFSFGTKTDDKPVPENKPVTESKPATSLFGNSSTPAFSFGSSESKPNDKPAFSFGNKQEDKPNDNQEKPPADKPLFSFANKPVGEAADKPNDKPNDKPAFSFANGSSEKSEKPAFSFGGGEKSDNKPGLFGDKPGFSFGGKADEKPADKPTFSFASNDKADKPAFSFGSSQEKPAFSFGAKTDDKPAEKPAFSFGAKAEDRPAEKPAFSFGAKADDKPAEKPAFSFGAKSDDKPAFSFGNKSEDKPTFSFGNKSDDKPAEKSAEKPAFSFGAKPDDKPAFSFGAKPDDKPAFSLGNSDNKPAFNFSSKPETKDSDDKKESENPEEHEVEGNFTPVAELGNKSESPATGEENENVLYTKRTKLMLFNKEDKTNPYASKGVGELKILQNQETKKCRLLIRADGGLRVLLNSAINSTIQYDTIGDGSLIRFPVVNTNQEIDTYILKVKTKNDGDELLNEINQHK